MASDLVACRGDASSDGERPIFEDVMQHPNDDIHIEQAIRAELSVSLAATGRRFVGVAVAQGVVHLTGFVDNYAQKWAVERAAASVVGVKDMRDYIHVLPPRDQSDDRRIQMAAKRVLEWDARVPDDVYGEVTDGVLRLCGIVERFSEREAAEEAVRYLIGVRDIVNEIRVTPAVVTADIDAAVDAAIRRRFGPDGQRITFAISAGVVTLFGVVRRFAMLDEVERIVRVIPGVTRTDNHLLVA